MPGGAAAGAGLHGYGKSPFRAEVGGKGQKETVDYFAGMSLEAVERQVSLLLDLLEKAAMKEAYRGRFQSSSHDLSARITNNVLF